VLLLQEIILFVIRFSLMGIYVLAIVDVLFGSGVTKKKEVKKSGYGVIWRIGE